MPPKGKKQVTIYLAPEELESLRRYAEEQDVTMSMAVNRALEEARNLRLRLRAEARLVAELRRKLGG